MKTIIAGSRDFTDFEHFNNLLDEFHKYGWVITRVVSGCARGVDFLGELWAEQEDIAVDKFPAEWEHYGKSAGYRRNALMANYAEALIAFWDGKSKGTENMINQALNRGLYIKVFYV